MTKVAVVILNYNGETYLKKFLPTVLRHSKEAEVIIADNASTDNSVSFLKEWYPDIRLICLKSNLGFAGGYNEVLNQIEAEYFVLLNSDVEVGENWINPVISFLDQNSEYAACQPKILDFNNKDKFEYAGACGGFLDFLAYPFCRGRIFDTAEEDYGQYDNPIDIFWASGACLFIRSRIFKEVKGFDVDFFAHMEEIDLCWRIHSLGLKVKSIPVSIVYHVGGGTLSKSSPFKTYLNFRNGIYLMVKNLPLNKLILKLPVRVFLDWIAAVKFLFEGNGKHSLAVLKAHFSASKNIRRIYSKRERISAAPKSKLMIFEYYLKGKKEYSSIQ